MEQKMTYREYLENCKDEFERTVIIANLARKHPDYDRYSPNQKRKVLKELLDTEMPQANNDND
jgi:hypothetical protein